MANKKDSDRSVKQCPEGTILFREGEVGDRMYVIKSGVVRLTKQVMDQRVTLEDLGSGEFCGGLALVNDQPRATTATVLEDASIIGIDAAQFENMLRNNTEIALRMLKKISQRLTHAHYRISNLILRDNKARLLHQLRQEVRAYTSARGKTIHHPTPLPDNLADILSLEIGEIKHLLNQLIHDELISVDRKGYFQILDEAALERYLMYLELHDRFGGRSN